MWLDSVAHQRIHDTTKEKPAVRLQREQSYLQPLPTDLPTITTSGKPTSKRSLVALEQTLPLHHNLAIYDQLMEGSL